MTGGLHTCISSPPATMWEPLTSGVGSTSVWCDDPLAPNILCEEGQRPWQGPLLVDRGV